MNAFIKWNGDVIADGFGALLIIVFFIALVWVCGYAAGRYGAKSGD